ncbi:MAG: hypothetical protein JNL13_03990 [Chitinophagaceae bacterium]|nr:hypothetical protein [Chitinophagaceae bacterium]
MKAIPLLLALSFFFAVAMAQNGNMRQHAPKQRLKSELADSMRRKGMGLPADTSKDLMYNEQGPKIDVEKAPTVSPSGKKPK